MKKIGFVLFENYWQRKDIGSSRIRGHWIIKYMPNSELFIQGKQYDAIIFQKAYWKEMAREFKGVKIFDICDPDWLDGTELVSFMKEMDAITVPTENLKKALSEMTDKPIYVIQDSIDFEIMNKPKEHKERAKKVAWFGYSHNFDVLDPTLLKLRKLGLTLKVISDGSYNSSECTIENVKWNKDTWQNELQDADFCLLPEKLAGRWLFKSQNKTHQALALGLPVAKNAQDLERFMEAEERTKEIEEKYKWIRENCDVKKAAERMLEIINSIKK